jgi:Tir chaperone protein (CesT) family
MKLSAPLLALAVLTAPAAAQSDPLVRPLPPAAAGTEALGRFLHELGYAPKALSPDVYQVTVERDRWPVHVMLSLSTDGRRVWLECKFTPVEDPDKVAPQAWKRLLEANEKIGPAHFAFDKTDKRIHLYKSFDNQGISAARLKAELDQFDLTVRKTKDYWSGDNFKPVIASTEPTSDPAKFAVPTAKGQGESTAKTPDLPPPPVAPELRESDRMEGEWTVTEIHVKGRKTPDEVLKERRAGLTISAATPGHSLPDGKLGTGPKLTAELRMAAGRSRTVAVKFPSVSEPLIPSPGSPRIEAIDFVDEDGSAEQGIYKLDGDTLTICFAGPGEPRPMEFKSTEQSRSWLMVLKKAK